MKTIAVIDGNSLMHRAFHAVPSYMTSPDGRPTNACFGFIQMLLRLVDDFKPDGIICAFDAGVPAFRLEALDGYKAQRPPTDPSLKAQFPLITKLLESLNIPILRMEDWEGDDILGTVAARAEDEGLCALLVTGDKDALQLASQTTQIVNNKTGMTDVVVYGPEQVVERFGVTPDRVPDFLGLMGDSSDNIPGIPGVGPKTAKKLLQEYGTLELVLENAASIKGKLGQNIAEHGELAKASKVVATIIRDLPLEIDFDNLSFPAFDEQQAKEAFGELAMTQHLKKLLALQNAGQPEAQVVKEETVTIAEPIIEAEAALAFLMRGLEDGEVIAAYITDADIVDDNETLQLDLDEHGGQARQLFVASSRGTARFSGGSDGGQLARAITEIIRDGYLVAHDVKSLLKEVLPANRDEAAHIKATDIDPNRIFDLSLAAYLLDSTKNFDKLSKLLEEHLESSYPKPSDAIPQGAIIATMLLELYEVLKPAVEADSSRECLERIELPLIPVLLQMERLGVNLDAGVLKELSNSFADTIKRLHEQIIEAAGEKFNPDSPKQLGAILFEKFKLPVGKKTRTGYSTDAATLAELTKLHPLPTLMIEYRELTKLKSTYLDALPRLVAGDGHIHTTFNQAVTATGRLSSSDPNLQNIPVRSELGRQIRAAFIPDARAFFDGGEEALLLSADYSQIELRLLAHLSEDIGLMAAFRDGQDFHSATAAQVFGVSLEEVTPQLRSRAKAVNFGIVYGQQAYGLSQSLGIPYREADEMIERYFAVYPRVRAFLDELIAQAYETGWVETMFGRKRHIHELKSNNPNLRGFGERTAMNHPLQGSAADIIKLAMIEIQHRLDREGYASQMILQVHDELVFNCVAPEVERLSAMVAEVMEHVVELRVPVLVDIGIGANWSLAH